MRTHQPRLHDQARGEPHPAGPMSWSGLLARAAVLLVLAAAYAPAAFSQPTAIARGATAQGIALEAVACPALRRCTAVDADGREVTFDPSAPATPTPTTIDHGSSLSGVACPSARQCTAVDREGRQVTFDPRAPRDATRTRLDRDSLKHLAGLACPSIAQCSVVDAYNTPPSLPMGQLPAHALGLEVVTFDPRRAAMAAHTAIDASPDRQSSPDGIACPSVRQCTVVSEEELEYAAGPYGGAAEEVTFDPMRGFQRGPAPEHPSFVQAWEPTFFRTAEDTDLSAVACAAANQCTALASGERSVEVTFNPRTPRKATRATVRNESWHSVACPSVSQCTAIGGDLELTFNPRSPGSSTTALIDDVAMLGVACPSISQCTAVDSGGREVTFNPTAPKALTRTAIDTGW